MHEHIDVKLTAKDSAASKVACEGEGDIAYCATGIRSYVKESEIFFKYRDRFKIRTRRRWWALLPTYIITYQA